MLYGDAGLVSLHCSLCCMVIQGGKFTLLTVLYGDAGLESLHYSLCCVVIQGWKVYITHCVVW